MIDSCGTVNNHTDRWKSLLHCIKHLSFLSLALTQVITTLTHVDLLYPLFLAFMLSISQQCQSCVMPPAEKVHFYLFYVCVGTL